MKLRLSFPVRTIFSNMTTGYAAPELQQGAIVTLPKMALELILGMPIGEGLGDHHTFRVLASVILITDLQCCIEHPVEQEGRLVCFLRRCSLLGSILPCLRPPPALLPSALALLVFLVGSTREYYSRGSSLSTAFTDLGRHG